MSEPRFFDFISRAQSAAASLRVRSALNPMLWMCAIVSLPCLILSYLAHGHEPMSTILVLLGAIPIVFTVLGFAYFAVAAPEKLQSEDYQLRHETLELIKQKGSALELSPSS